METNVVEEVEEKREKRKRKVVEVFGYEEQDPSLKKEWSVTEGKGESLSGMEGVCLQISRLKANDVLLKTMHTMFYQRQGKKTTLRKNLRAFSGFHQEGEELKKVQEKARAKLQKLPMPQVKRLMDTLLIDRSECEFRGRKDKQGRTREQSRRLGHQTFRTHEKGTGVFEKESKEETQEEEEKAKKPEKTGPKKPLSAYMCFCKAKRADVVAANPELKGAEVFKKMGEVWKGYSEEEKKPFEEMASQDKERYQRELAENPHQPRRRRERQNPGLPRRRRRRSKKLSFRKIQAAMMMMTCLLYRWKSKRN